jgi:exodeoxyribonuclease V alpha subunit
LHSTNNLESISGSIERITFHSEENGFCVLGIKVNGQKPLVMVVGNLAAITVGECIQAYGVWDNSRDHGLQFKAQQLSIIPPSTVEGMEKYLGSGIVQGIGAHFAKKLVQAFAEEVFNIIEQTPEKLLSVEGIGKKRIAQITASWNEQKVVRDIMVFLQSHGVGTALAVRIYKIYGRQAIDKVTANPYSLSLDIEGIGFKIADHIAMHLSIAKDSLIRAQAGIRHVLKEFSKAGHCAILVESLLKKADQLLEIPASVLQQAIEDEVSAQHIVYEETSEGKYIFLVSIHQAEVGVAQHIARLHPGVPPWQKIELEQALPKIKNNTNIVLADSQKAAIELVMNNKCSVITGGPGVGKTTIINTILKILLANGMSVKLAAPTGRAAKRMSQATGLEAVTIHRLLEFDPGIFGFKKDQEAPLKADFIVIDESSMVDIVLMNQLLQAIPTHAALLLVGDVDQLPSVGPGCVLANIIDSKKIATAKLTEIFRQAASSHIIVNAHKINEGQFPQVAEGDTDFYFIAADNQADIQNKLLTVVGERIPKKFKFNPITDIQVLTPMNRGILGTRNFNIELQKLLNPNSQPQVTRFGWTFAPGDKVMQTKNNYEKEVFNGDIGVITHVNVAAGEVKIEFDNKLTKYELSELDQISLAYATTIHKSQGSEYPAIVIALAMEHYALLERNLLYTAVTRGKKLVVIIGQKKALARAVSVVKSTARVTRLQERIAADLEV